MVSLQNNSSWLCRLLNRPLGCVASKRQPGRAVALSIAVGAALTMTDMMSGQVQLIFESMSSISPHHRAGRLRGIAVTGLKRSPSLKEKYAANGVDPGGGTVEEYGALIRREVEKYAMIAKTLKAKVD